MTKYHSDEYIKFLKNISPDNMSEFNKQMQKSNHMAWSRSGLTEFACFCSQCGRGLSRVRWSLRVLPAVGRRLGGRRREAQQTGHRHCDQLGWRAASREKVGSLRL